jgi:flagellin-like protein
MKIKKKKGVSPVIATTLLIAMVVVIGLIVFLWFRGFTEEAVTKFGGQNIKQVCGQVQFDSSYSGGIIFLSNEGRVPIYSVKLKVEKPGNYQTLDITDISDWPSTGLNQGGVFSAPVENFLSGATEITVIPVLRGTTKSGARTHICEEQYGEVIIV